MSSEDFLFKIIFALAGTALGLLAFVEGMRILLALVIYMLVPVLLFSGFYYFLMSYSAKKKVSDEKKSEGNDGYLCGRYRHKRLIVVYSFLIFVILLVFHMGSERRFVEDKKKGVITQYIEWPKLNDLYNSARSGGYKASFFEYFRELSKKKVVFDRRDLGFLAWLSLFLTGPLLYIYFKRDEDLDIVGIRNEVSRLNHENRKKFLDEKKRYEKRLKNLMDEYKDRNQEIVEINHRLVDEINVLRAKLEFSSDLPTRLKKDSEEIGVLDQDIF